MAIRCPRSPVVPCVLVGGHLATGAAQALLRDRGDEPTVAIEDAALSQRAATPADGEFWSYRSHSSARNGRMNHMAWSSEAACGSMPGCGTFDDPSNVMSLM